MQIICILLLILRSTANIPLPLMLGARAPLFKMLGWRPGAIPAGITECTLEASARNMNFQLAMQKKIKKGTQKIKQTIMLPQNINDF